MDPMYSETRATLMDPEWVAESNLGRILGVGISFHVVAIIFVALRTYTRVYIVKSFGKDDAMMLLTLVFLTAGAVIPQIVAAPHGLGRHQATISPEDFKIYLLMTFIQALFASVSSLGFLKISIAFALLRLHLALWYRKTLYGLMAFICAYVILGWVTVLAWCDPVPGQWDRDIPAKCYDKQLLYFFALFCTCCNIFTDICFAVLPVPVIWNLQMKRRTRIYLVSVFSLGYTAVAAGFVKAYFQATSREDPDKSFNTWIQFWGLLQQNLGVIAACAPSLKPLFNRVLKLGTEYSNQYNKGTEPIEERIRRASAYGHLRSGSDGDKDIELELPRMRSRTSDSKFRTSIKALSHSGSEDLILQSNVSPAGVMKTTEMTVHNF